MSDPHGGAPVSSPDDAPGGLAARPTASAAQGAAPARKRGGVSLSFKLALLLALVALVPTAIASQLLLAVNREAVQNSERQLQTAVVAEVTGLTTRSLERGERDLRTIALVVSRAAADPALLQGALAPVLETSRDLSGVRLEVPSAKVSTPLSQEKGGAAPPESNEALRKAADEHGVAFAVMGGEPLLVVPVPQANVVPRSVGGARAYVTARVDLTALREQLQILAEMRFEGAGARLVLVDRDRQVIAEHGTGLGPGTDASTLPVWAPLSQHRAGLTRVGVVEEFTAEGEAWVGGLETVPDVGWTAAVWRPQAEAYQSLTRMRQRGILVSAAAALIALALGLAGGTALAHPIQRLVVQTSHIAQRAWRRLSPPDQRGDELGQLSRSIHHMAQELEASELQIAQDAKLRGDLGRFLSTELVESIVRGEHSLALGGQRREVSVLFADVVAFTPLAESHSAEEVVKLLNDLFSVLTEIVFRHQGTVDKFIGDCIMAVWGAPVPQADHADRALLAAEDMMHFLETANLDWKARYGVEIRLGIGVNSGEAIVGNIGSDKRMEYTVIGDVVNVAARLESVARPNQVLVAEATSARATDASLLAPLGERNLTGRDRPVQVFELRWQ
ncbi:MAG: HAMP domain-containing protein [Polyangiaceae bacterium]|nr:HAMP domain-containing protein [Polyangiaceae bacterium]MCW5789345.1 HAMP domain-containing protein [Polyangiaceae bacterium]